MKNLLEIAASFSICASEGSTAFIALLKESSFSNSSLTIAACVQVFCHHMLSVTEKSNFWCAPSVVLRQRLLKDSCHLVLCLFVTGNCGVLIPLEFLLQSEYFCYKRDLFWNIWECDTLLVFRIVTSGSNLTFFCLRRFFHSVCWYHLETLMCFWR